MLTMHSVSSTHSSRTNQAGRGCRRSRLTSRVSTVQLAATEVVRIEADLRTWVDSHEGYIHPSLKLVEATQECGCRGVIATTDILEQDLSEAPLIAVPQSLYMTTDSAKQFLSKHRLPTNYGTDSWLNDVRNLVNKMTRNAKERPIISNGAMLLAVLLAHERSKGSDSFWHAYILSLPEQPSAAWYLSSSDLQQALLPYGQLAQGWESAVSDARSKVHQQVEQAVSTYGKALDGVDEDSLRWSAAQVMSRAFGGGEDVGLAPFIDLCNHKASAASPAAWLPHDSANEGMHHQGGDSDAVMLITSSHSGTPLPLQAGQELFISYSCSPSCTPLSVFMNFGFVPPEVLQRYNTARRAQAEGGRQNNEDRQDSETDGWLSA